MSLVAWVSIVAVLASAVIGDVLARRGCKKVDDCSCLDEETGKIVSLHSLANTNNTAALVYRDLGQNYDYHYNPCVAFTLAAGTQCEDVAICQVDHGIVNSTRYYGLANQSTALFLDTADNGLVLQYQGHPFEIVMPRTSSINLVCNPEATTPEFVFNREIRRGEYMFNLTSACACPGACLQSSTCVPDSEDKCSCRLSDGESVNIRSLDQPDAPLRAVQGDLSVTLNPCSGFNTTTTACRDVTVCLQHLDDHQDFGVASTAEYGIQGNSVVLTYHSSDGKRHTNIKLVCDPEQRHNPRLTFGQPVTDTELNVELHSVCACANGCLNPKTTCHRVDDCSCRLDNNRGTLSLHSLDNPFAPITYRNTNSGLTSSYYYNPCTNFTPAQPNENCQDIAVCRTLVPPGVDFSLGVQTNVTYRVSTFDPDSVTLVYQGGTEGRESYVRMQCNVTLEAPVLLFDGLDPSLHAFHFTLHSRDACLKPSR
eukprot:scpid65127/ scgid31929/ 